MDAVRLVAAAAADGSTACGLIALRLVDACVAVPRPVKAKQQIDTVAQRANVTASGSQCCCYRLCGHLESL